MSEEILEEFLEKKLGAFLSVHYWIKRERQGFWEVLMWDFEICFKFLNLAVNFCSEITPKSVLENFPEFFLIKFFFKN